MKSRDSRDAAGQAQSRLPEKSIGATTAAAILFLDRVRARGDDGHAGPKAPISQRWPRGYVSVTPLRLDRTDEAFSKRLTATLK